MTLREYVLAQSTLPPGNTIRNHINNPITAFETTTWIDGIDVEDDTTEFDLESGDALICVC